MTEESSKWRQCWQSAPFAQRTIMKTGTNMSERHFTSLKGYFICQVWATRSVILLSTTSWFYCSSRRTNGKLGMNNSAMLTKATSCRRYLLANHCDATQLIDNTLIININQVFIKTFDKLTRNWWGLHRKSDVCKNIFEPCQKRPAL